MIASLVSWVLAMIGGGILVLSTLGLDPGLAPCDGALVTNTIRRPGGVTPVAVTLSARYCSRVVPTLPVLQDFVLAGAPREANESVTRLLCVMTPRSRSPGCTRL